MNQATDPELIQSAIEHAQQRQRKRLLAMLSVPLLAAAIGSYFYFTAGRYVSTENAFLKADKVMISPEVNGAVVELLVAENQPVHQGDVLFRINAESYRVALAKSEAKREKTRSDILALQAAYKAKQAELSLARNNAAFAEREYRRQQELSKKGFASQTQLDDRKHLLDVSTQQISVIEQDLARLLAGLNGNATGDIESHPSFLEAQAEWEQAQLNLAKTEIHAPFDGIATNVPKLGQYLTMGSPAMSVVANSGLWIEANFNETDLTRVVTGQHVDIRIDTYPKFHWNGTVSSISPATGAEFSILPPQNATGNWVKVIQRIPLRIEIELNPDAPVLRAGMSATVEIDTRSLPGS